MNKIENQTFENVVVNFDGYQYVNCKFNHCQLLFTGMGIPNLVNCEIRSDCAWTFAGPAQHVISFLSSLYQTTPAGKALVDSIIESIRNGVKPQPLPVRQPDNPETLH